MNTTQKLIDLVKKEYSLTSDYQFSKLMGISLQRTSNYRTGRNNFDNLMAFRVCKLLEIDPAEYVAKINLERSKKLEERNQWKKIIEQITSTAAVITLIIGGLFSPAQDVIADDQSYTQPKTIYYVKWALDFLIELFLPFWPFSSNSELLPLQIQQ